MASTMDKEAEHIMIAMEMTENSRKIIAEEFIDCDVLQDVLVSFVKVDAINSFITNRITHQSQPWMCYWRSFSGKMASISHSILIEALAS